MSLLMERNKVLLMHLASFVVMFVSTYTVLASLDHLYLNINKVYIAALMTGLMGVINVAVMWNTYKSSQFRLGGINPYI
jgi:ABC-type nitrate/sulfonate/bicarbonate transport system permease component